MGKGKGLEAIPYGYARGNICSYSPPNAIWMVSGNRQVSSSSWPGTGEQPGEMGPHLPLTSLPDPPPPKYPYPPAILTTQALKPGGH